VEWIGEPPNAALSVFEEDARSMLSENQSPDLPFRFSVNPYRGCMHACAYCYARPSHQYLGWGAGTDFDRKIVVKRNAPEVLRAELMKPSWEGDTIVFSGITDCYQPLEASYGLTRRCLEVCLDFQNPVTITTKGALVRRDADVLGDLARRARATVFVSIPFASDDTARAIEPYASRASHRFDAIRALSEAGVTTGIAVAPVIPGLTDSSIPELLSRAREAGASRAFMVLLRLPREVLPVFDERLEKALPERVEKVRRAIREVRGGEMNASSFGERFRGKGARWDMIEGLFDATCRRLGMNSTRLIEEEEKTSTFRRPSRQGTLFDI
jgi:DNA repair photolyase